MQKKHILVEHNKEDCYFKWYITPDNLLRGYGCPNCSSSKGEKKIRKFLLKNNINFKPQFWFSDLKGYKGWVLKFDFAVFDNDDNLKSLIEFDGKGHFSPISQYGGIESFNKTQAYDNLKNQYCINNKIPLIRIPFWDFRKISIILEEHLREVVNM